LRFVVVWRTSASLLPQVGLEVLMAQMVVAHPENCFDVSGESK
jgi:hypothetical protein